ncbi:MAG: hypothetical protein CMM93_00805 [Rickettsiales bacterium]|nr:hypothetical protein [Rickettsiales bacterium]|tara:strand:+ start:451 stop:1245 length:795 start_codon:yes stop_codon:yes gene_type:complete
MEFASLLDMPILWPEIRLHPFVLSLLFVVGLCLGSFISLISYRMVHEMPWVNVRSQCTSCKKALRARELVPVFSWVRQGGKCSCGATISVRYPIIECISGLCVILTAWAVPDFWSFLILTGLVLSILTLCVTDFEYYIIPDEIQIAMLLLGIAYVMHQELPFDTHLIGLGVGLAVGLGLHFGAKWILKKDGLGFGDVKLLAIIGLWIGLAPFPVFFFLSGMFGIFTAIGWRLLGLGERFPFGPALAWAMLLIVMVPEVGQILQR